MALAAEGASRMAPNKGDTSLVVAPERHAHSEYSSGLAGTPQTANRILSKPNRRVPRTSRRRRWRQMNSSVMRIILLALIGLLSMSHQAAQPLDQDANHDTASQVKGPHKSKAIGWLRPLIASSAQTNRNSYVNLKTHTQSEAAPTVADSQSTTSGAGPRPTKAESLAAEYLDDERRAKISKAKILRDEISETRRRLMVHQLADLIMNNEPEIISARLSGADQSSLLGTDELDDSMAAAAAAAKSSYHQPPLTSSESSSLAKLTAQPLVMRPQQSSDYPADETLAPDQQSDQSSSSTGDNLAGSNLSGSTFNNQEDQETAAQSGGQTVTCSPDYEDQALVEASGNLTAEEQKQLLAGVDSSGLLTPSSGGDTPTGNDSSTSGSANGQMQRPLIGQCVQPGSRTIEIITKTITPILFGIIIVVGLLGNIIVMLVILEDRKTDRELTPTNLLILDLSLADLSFIIFCIPFTGWDYAVGHWVFGPLWCKFNQYLIVVCALSSIYTLVLMSIDRFLAIVYPIECISYRTSKNMFYAIGIKWILILVIASPTIAMHGLIDSVLGPDQYNCRFLADQYNPLHFQITFFVTSYLFPLALIFFLYLSVLNKLWFGTKPRGHRESNKMLESKKKVTFLVASIVVVFAICWCPIQIMLILMRLKTYRITATYVAIQVFSHILGYMNSCVNPIVYAFASETFTNSFKRSSPGRLCHWLIGVPKYPNGNSTSNNRNNQSNTTNNNNNNNHMHNLQDPERTVVTHVVRPSNSNSNSNNNNGNTSGNPNDQIVNRLSTASHHIPAIAEDGPSSERTPSNHNNGDHYASYNDNRYSSSATTSTSVMATPAPAAGGVATNGSSTQQNKLAPLEPRDRIMPPPTPPVVSQGHKSHTDCEYLVPSGREFDSQSASDRVQDTRVPMQIMTNGSGGHSHSDGQINHQPAANRTMPTKQQLVARMDLPGGQIAHECEPCDTSHLQ